MELAALNARRFMESDDLENVLSRVAQLIDCERKCDLLGMLEDADGRVPLEACPSLVYHTCITKGALVAEIVYRELTGRVRNRNRWYKNK